MRTARDQGSGTRGGSLPRAIGAWLWFPAGVAGVLVLALATSAFWPATQPEHPDIAVERDVRDRDIAFYQARVLREPFGATDLAQLAQLLLQRARATGSWADLLAAESLATRSARHRLGHNGAALQTLSSALLAQHRYGEALSTARRLVAHDPEDPGARGLLGEILLECGRYEEADSIFRSLAAYATSLGLAPRLARWHELNGRPEKAEEILARAAADAEQTYGVSLEQRAWYYFRLGDLALRYGRLHEAETALERAGTLAPGDARLLAAQARLHFARGAWDAAIADANQAAALILDPGLLGLVAEAARQRRDTAMAHEYSRAMGVAVSQQPEALHRAWAVTMLDLGLPAEAVLSRARGQLAGRQDIYGYDAVAWALYHLGQPQESWRFMRQALRRGAQDPMLLYHAGFIRLDTGDSIGGAAYLRQALLANPHYHPLWVARARAALREGPEGAPDE